MPFTLTQYLLVSLILLGGSLLQGAVGFASGLFGIPLLMLTGIALPDAVAISLVAAAVQNFTAAWQLRSQLDLSRALRPMLIRFATLPLGVLVLALVSREEADLAGQMVGVVVLVLVAMQQAPRVALGRSPRSARDASRPPQSLHPIWEWIAFGAAGFLLGLCGIGGPPMVLWVLAQDWPMNRGRAFLYFLFASGIPVQALLLWLAFGRQIASAMVLGLAITPAVLLGLFGGFTLARLLPDRILRGLCVTILVIVAISAIATPYLR
jgi:uncharacterized protein